MTKYYKYGDALRMAGDNETYNKIDIAKNIIKFTYRALSDRVLSTTTYAMENGLLCMVSLCELGGEVHYINVAGDSAAACVADLLGYLLDKVVCPALK